MLDTSVLLFDANSILKFGENTVYIPLVVIEELDRFKKYQNENGRNARAFSRIVDELRKKGSLAKGIDLDNGGKLVISLDAPMENDAAHRLDLSTNDNLILSRAIKLRESGQKVILLSKDINLRLKADAFGIPSEDYGTLSLPLDELYSGRSEGDLKEEYVKEFEENRFLPLSSLPVDENNVFANQYFIFHQEHNPGKKILGRYSHKKAGLVPLIKAREGVWGIYPKNVEQQFAFDALLNNEVKLITLTGKAGTGKTLLAIAAGLEMCVAQNIYKRLLVSRPIQPMGRDIGFLPGDIEEKLGPWMQPIFDNMDFLFGSPGLNGSGSWDELINKGLLHIEPLTYIRGRSIPSQYLIVDEAQNLTPHEVKTIVTRAGDGTKVILTGDCEQIDSPYLDSVNNGLAYCVNRLKNEDLVAHINLLYGERSPLSEMATNLL